MISRAHGKQQLQFRQEHHFPLVPPPLTVTICRDPYSHIYPKVSSLLLVVILSAATFICTLQVPLFSLCLPFMWRARQCEAKERYINEYWTALFPILLLQKECRYSFHTSSSNLESQVNWQWAWWREEECKSLLFVVPSSCRLQKGLSWKGHREKDGLNSSSPVRKSLHTYTHESI